MFILIIISFLLLINSSLVINTVIYSINIFKKSIFPSLFPFFIISELLINYGFIEFISKLFKPLMRLFKINQNCSFILVMSMISGFPSNSKYTKDLYLKGIINEYDASKILMFTHFSNPLFIMGAISITFLNNKKIGLFILIIHYLTNFIIGFLLRNLIKTDINITNIDNHKSKSFSNVLSNAILNSFNTLFLILGTIIIFLVITNLLNEYIAFNPLIKGIISGILEMTGGISNISSLNISLKLKSTIIGMILSFGGISVHMQVKSIISDTPIKYHPFLVARLLHTSITGILIYYLFDLIFIS
jgi:sporulation integral membrane protein YlbJ